jgi:hypothetical protein
MNEIIFASRLPAACREELESLMFFHPGQTQVSGAIDEAIEVYGVPQVTEDGGYLRLRVGEAFDVQNLFALVGSGEKTELAAAAIYLRTDIETIVLLHIAVKEEYSFAGGQPQEMVTMKTLTKLREIARQIKGVRHIEVLYGNGVTRRLEVYRQRPGT